MQHADISPPETRSRPIHRSPLSDSLEPVNALSESPAGFDPVRWLAEFKAVGGGWIVRDHLSFVIQVERQTDDKLSKARELIVSLSAEDRTAIVAYLRDGRA
ncbi:MAG: hypothetical protein M0R03_14335 [Novosphingobium sp.]|nr:hypothetical protein [Novosphingobium sp.]